MNPLTPSGTIIAGVLILVVAAVSLGVFVLDSDDNGSNGDATPKPTTVAESPDESDEHSDADDPAATPVPESDPDEETEPNDAVEPEPRIEPLTEEELARYQPNELGRIMVLMYHRLDDGDTVWSRTPEQFRQDIQWLYDNDFYVIPIRDYIRNEIEAPAGKRPVVLTFDDGTVNQFKFIEQADGTVIIDPDSAIGILEDFFNRYDDFGRGGLFSILPMAPFAWPDASDQMPYAGQKLQWLVDNGYELGNHTVGHVNLREISDDEIKSELARAEDMMRNHVPDVEVSVLAVPFGMYPTGGDTSIFEGWEYEGQQYQLEGALMVGAEPAFSPVHTDFDPMWIPRVNADDEQLGRWFSFVEENPGIMYVSDGNPDTITIPKDLHPWLVDTLDEAKAEGKTIIRY
jgi:peptidoglycan/xylan/chitin deacetylase (PgdA/CDA1 family)